ncbi:MAG TPA: GNAT family N-acetyltransferase [Dehalococcoidia bacterium]|jgi:RimJ/RimL family protein N-acetyltransferase|nr:GNAT family N-acetyltransferase [Dehalococcoidia bacterium]
MSGTDIQTENLKLVIREPEEVLTWIDAMSASDKAEISADWLARVRASTSADPWTCGFAMVHRASDAVIGSCGYKSPPGPDGVVEIAYGVDAGHQGRGYATEAARALVAYAFASGRVRTVRAHTLPEPNASTRVLAKCGFERLGEVVDPDDGLVWRWEIEEEAAPAG